MTEILSKNNERPKLTEHKTNSEILPSTKHESSQQTDSNLNKAIESINKRVKNEAVSSESIQIEDKSPVNTSTIYLTKDLKNIAFKRVIKDVQLHLNAPEKIFSNFVHRPSIETISDKSAQTLARPSGLLSGGLFALVGTILLLYMSRRYGFEYNYFIFILLLVTGFLFGIIVEAVINIVLKKHQ